MNINLAHLARLLVAAAIVVVMFLIGVAVLLHGDAILEAVLGQ